MSTLQEGVTKVTRPQTTGRYHGTPTCLIAPVSPSSTTPRFASCRLSPRDARSRPGISSPDESRCRTPPRSSSVAPPPPAPNLALQAAPAPGDRSDPPDRSPWTKKPALSPASFSTHASKSAEPPKLGLHEQRNPRIISSQETFPYRASGRTTKPSFCAAVLNLLSRQTKEYPPGSFPAQMIAAASCRESAAFSS